MYSGISFVDDEEIISLTVCIYNVRIEDNKLLSVRTFYVRGIDIIINIYLVWWLPVTILITTEIKSGKLRQFYVPDMICDDFKKIIGNAYELENYTIDQFEFSYKKFIGKNSNEKYVGIVNDDKCLDEKHFKL